MKIWENENENEAQTLAAWLHVATRPLRNVEQIMSSQCWHDICSCAVVGNMSYKLHEWV
jgi:hypothetical protein